MKLVSVAEMRQIEQEADAAGLTYEMMMENAGHNLSREILKLSYAQGSEEEIQVIGLVGPGNNGGDTLVALTHLAEKGWKARAYLVKRKISGDPLIKRLEEAEGEIYQADKDADYQQLAAFLGTADVVLDGVLGTGMKLPIHKEVGQVLAAMNSILEALEWRPFIVAVDCPSGVDCDTGAVASECIQADATVTMAAVKQGLLKLPAFDMVGELRVVEIGALDGIGTWQEVKNEVANDELGRSLLPSRPSDAHKGSFGTALVVAGSVNYTGAALLAGKAAARSGVGLVSLAVPAPLHMTLAGHFLEATWILLPHELGCISSSAADVLAESLERVTAILLGPGLGLEDTTRDFVANLLQGSPLKGQHGRMGFVQNSSKPRDQKTTTLPPFVVDADGLKILARITGWEKLLPPIAILTPHPGEMSIMTGLPVEEISQNRLAIASKFATQWGHVVVLKGAFTVVAAPDGRTTTIPIATPALAHAGTGDVLAGLITGLRAQGLDPYETARLGAWIHAYAGEVAAQIHGNTRTVLAGDVLEAVEDILSDLE